MEIGEQYKEIVEKKYAEAQVLGVDEIILDEKTMGGLKLFIGKKPKMILSEFVMEDGKEVYIGGELEETAS